MKRSIGSSASVRQRRTIVFFIGLTVMVASATGVATAGPRRVKQKLELLESYWHASEHLPKRRRIDTLFRVIATQHQRGFRAAQKSTRGLLWCGQALKNPRATLTAPSMGATSHLHLRAYRLQQSAVPIIQLAQSVERRVLVRTFTQGISRSPREYEQQFVDSLQYEFDKFNFLVVWLDRMEGNTSSAAFLRERFDDLEVWVDLLPGGHGFLTHPLQVLRVIKNMREHGGASIDEIQYWYQSMGSGKRASIARFPRGTNPDGFTELGRIFYERRAEDRNPWVLNFERFHGGATSPINLSRLLGTAMIHPYWASFRPLFSH
jgi:hypothetical protein